MKAHLSNSIHESHESWMSPEQVTPSQHADMRRPSNHLSPEQMLTLAVLDDACKCLNHHSRSIGSNHGKQREKAYTDACAWLQDDSGLPFSFGWVCEFLSIEPTSLRARLASGTIVLPRLSPKGNVVMKIAETDEGLRVR